MVKTLDTSLFLVYNILVYDKIERYFMTVTNTLVIGLLVLNVIIWGYVMGAIIL